ncbi:MAG: hypothetical protein ABIJ91_02895 [Candidatus Kuenenbacteria bacterium]
MKILNIFFVVLGIIFFILIIGIGYIWFADPFNLKPLIPSGVSPISVIKTITGNNEVEIDNIDKNPLLTEEQEAQLESMGIEPADLPSEITPQMEKCFTQKLGEKRTSQIIQGDSPTPADFLKASSCLN